MSSQSSVLKISVDEPEKFAVFFSFFDDERFFRTRYFDTRKAAEAESDKLAEKFGGDFLAILKYRFVADVNVEDSQYTTNAVEVDFNMLQIKTGNTQIDQYIAGGLAR